MIEKDLLDSRIKHSTKPAASPVFHPPGQSRPALALRSDRLNKSEESPLETDEPPVTRTPLKAKYRTRSKTKAKPPPHLDAGVP